MVLLVPWPGIGVNGATAQATTVSDIKLLHILSLPLLSFNTSIQIRNTALRRSPPTESVTCVSSGGAWWVCSTAHFSTKGSSEKLMATILVDIPGRYLGSISSDLLGSVPSLAV